MLSNAEIVVTACYDHGKMCPCFSFLSETANEKQGSHESHYLAGDESAARCGLGNPGGYVMFRLPALKDPKKHTLVISPRDFCPLRSGTVTIRGVQHGA